MLAISVQIKIWLKIVFRNTKICHNRFSVSVTQNIVKIELAPSVEFEMANLERNFYTTSSCGVCGKASIEAVHSNEIPVN